jgi:hypothetical protein
MELEASQGWLGTWPIHLPRMQGRDCHLSIYGVATGCQGCAQLLTNIHQLTFNVVFKDILEDRMELGLGVQT